MKVCGSCGTYLEDNASFCNNCGARFQPVQPVQPAQPAYPQMNTKEPISIGGWIGRTLIPCIPLVGPLVYLIMLFIWSGDVTKEDTFRNWAKAQLIVMGIVIALTVIFGVLFGAALADLF